MLRSLLLFRKELISYDKNHPLFGVKIYDISDKLGMDGSLRRLPFWFEEDRFYADFEDLVAISAFESQFEINTIDLYKSFHYCEYEYLIEEDDYFEQVESEAQIAPSMSIFLILILLVGLNEHITILQVLFFLFFFLTKVTEIYEFYLNNSIFTYFNSSAISTSKDNITGFGSALIYPRQDFTAGYTTETGLINTEDLIFEDEEEYLS